MKNALITGITGQDGSYLAELLLEKGYAVHGIIRRVALENPEERLKRINHLVPRLQLHSGDIENYPRLTEILEMIRPDECYHLAAQSYVHESFDDCFSTMRSNIDGTLNILSALKNKAPHCKFYFAASSEMFGKVHSVPQNEETKFHPRSPYGVSKVAGFELTRNYREAYGLFACSGILFNHESPRRGYEFVTRKITHTIAKMLSGKDNVLILGNLDAKRDWGFARDYVEAMWLMLQQSDPDDYVVSTGKTHSVRDFLEIAFDYAKLDYEILDLHTLDVSEADKNISEIRGSEKAYVVQYPLFYRPAEVDLLIGDSRKARTRLNWEPKIGFPDLVKMMLQADIEVQ
ncbi:MAG: GDP-mannose 4,6-dehydratase [Desulfohalobiaceae bacterium]|nr:GDP-mannose 4,6-dehydratase [Desulfohalobiaceae bacterium]